MTNQQLAKSKTFKATDIRQNADNGYRYFLKYEENGSSGKNPIYVVGLNPSTADMKNPDPTMKRLIKLCVINGYDSFVMFNLYPQRATKPIDLEETANLTEFSNNINCIDKELPKGANVLLCYGSNIGIRNYLIDALYEIRKIGESREVEWKCINTTKFGIPVHPIGEPYGDFKPYQFIK